VIFNVNIILQTVWDPIVCALTECTSTMFCIWPDDGSMSRNMSRILIIDYQYMLCLLTE